MGTNLTFLRGPGYVLYKTTLRTSVFCFFGRDLDSRVVAISVGVHRNGQWGRSENPAGLNGRLITDSGRAAWRWLPCCATHDRCFARSRCAL